MAVQASVLSTPLEGALPTRVVAQGKIPFDVLRYIPEDSIRHYQIAPLAVSEGVLEVGIVDPDNIAAVDALNFITRKTGVAFKLFRISENDLEKILEMYRGLKGDVEKAVSDLTTGTAVQKDDDDVADIVPLDLNIAAEPAQDMSVTLAIAEDAPTVKIASTILRYAIDGRASDIHIEASPQGVKVRYRVDGELHTSVVLPLNTHRALVARFKVLSSIRLDEQRKPQDGRFSASIDGRQIDFRVSTFPSYYGEKIVIRILDHNQSFVSVTDLGLSERDLRVIRRALKRPHGLILISGPTGSGKSTTLYSMLSEIDRERLNVLSLEDPIEYFVDGVTQSQMKPEIGYTFASGLRTTLRQDPDVILVGEIRDSETAKLAVQAALTGHLVLSTIHTNDAVGTVSRLVDMGVEPYLIPPVLVLSMAQRLVKTLCPGTGKKVPLSASARVAIEAERLSLPEQHRFALPTEVFEAERTATCPTGTRGRMAVFEVLEMNTDIERIVLEQPLKESSLRAAARAQGMLTMREDALMKSVAGKLPFNEVSGLSSTINVEEEPALIAEDVGDAAVKTVV
ncbi:type II/IV secretion system protein [bacterium]|nr:type II/IV secretion system protein [bacterium]